MAGRRSKNRYVNTCKYVDSLQLFAASSPSSVVAQLEAHCIAVLHFLGSNTGKSGTIHLSASQVQQLQWCNYKFGAPLQ